MLPLPEGVPEEVPVVCNGHKARLILRTQRVVYGGHEMPASRFETLAGKDSAKRWKTSLYYLDRQGQQGQMMQDWLVDRELDRKALEGLARNAAQLKAWEDYTRHQVESVLQGLLEAVEGGEGGAAAPTAAQSPASGRSRGSGAEEEDAVTGTGDERRQQAGGGEGGDEERSGSGEEATRPRQPANGKLQQQVAQKLRLLQVLVKEEEAPASPMPNGHAPECLPGAAANGHASERGGGSSSGGASDRDTPAAEAPPSSGQGQGGEEEAEYGRSVSPDAMGGSEGERQGKERQEPQGQEQPGQEGRQQEPQQEPQQGGEGREPQHQWEQQQQPQVPQPPAEGGPPAEQDAGRAGGASGGPANGLLGRKRSYEEALGGGSGGPRPGEAGAEAGAAAASSQQPSEGGSPRPADASASEGVEGGWQRGPKDAGEQEQGQASQAAAGEAGAAAAGGAADGEGQPMVVDVICGRMPARFDARCMLVTLQSGQMVSPIEYERMSGRSASKKWKWSIRVDAGGGQPGMTLEDWLMERGLEGAVAPRSSKGTQEALRRHGEARPAVPAGSDGAPPPQALEGAGTQPAHRSGHPPEQQARAGSHGAEQECGAGAGAGAGAGNVSGPQQATAGAGLAAASAAPGGAELGAAAIQARLVKLEQRPAYNLRGSGGAPGGAPRFRDGKRAFLRALPQLATAGPTPHELCEVPLSRCWTPEDWAAHRLRQAARAAARAADGTRRPARGADLPFVVAGSANAYVDSLAPRVSLGPGVHDERPQSVKEKLEACGATEHARIAFGKSGIHGWGLFARVTMRQDSMVAEYRGVLVRASVAEARERRYRQQGRDCYLFNLDDQHVLDATRAGAISKFTNHSCSPSMYSKILNIDGRQRLVFFARHDIEVGQELTYNYRFEREEGEERVPCACGAPNCSGYLN